MLPFPHLGELGSATMPLMLVIGVGSIMPLVIDPLKGWHRSLLLGIAGLLALRYMLWRATETLAPFELGFDMIGSWLLFGLEALSILGSLSAFLILSRYELRRQEAAAPWGRVGAGGTGGTRTAAA